MDLVEVLVDTMTVIYLASFVAVTAGLIADGSETDMRWQGWWGSISAFLEYSCSGIGTADFNRSSYTRVVVTMGCTRTEISSGFCPVWQRGWSIARWKHIKAESIEREAEHDWVGNILGRQLDGGLEKSHVGCRSGQQAITCRCDGSLALGAVRTWRGHRCTFPLLDEYKSCDSLTDG